MKRLAEARREVIAAMPPFPEITAPAACGLVLSRPVVAPMRFRRSPTRVSTALRFR